VTVEIRLRTDDFRRWLERAQSDIVAGARNSLAQAVSVALQHAQSTALFKDRTGELRRSIVRFQVSTWRMGIKATAKHALFVEVDTKPHRIEARRARALRFVQGGAIRFARAVNHPGTKGTHFMQKAGDEGTAYLERALERVVRQAFR
jgi:predicted TIM-barrel fold metal-dependent hydrolase